MTESAGVAVFSRKHAGSDRKEFRAIGAIDAAPLTVRRVLDDAEAYPAFMPYVKESRVLSRHGDVAVCYQRIAPPVIGERDYTLKVQSEIQRQGGGAANYLRRWELANDLGPAPSVGVGRLTLDEGSWLLEPSADGKTRATYTIYCDAASSLPTMVLDMANQTAIPKLFDAIRKQAKLEKYRTGL